MLYRICHMVRTVHIYTHMSVCTLVCLTDMAHTTLQEVFNRIVISERSDLNLHATLKWELSYSFSMTLQASTRHTLALGARSASEHVYKDQKRCCFRYLMFEQSKYLLWIMSEYLNHIGLSLAMVLIAIELLNKLWSHSSVTWNNHIKHEKKVRSL